LLFAEGGARILVSVPLAQQSAWHGLVASFPAPVPTQRLGTVEDNRRLRISLAEQPLLTVEVARLAGVYEQAIPRRLAASA
jgi:phosphoribosylformylglycinamidine synthase